MLHLQKLIKLTCLHKHMLHIPICSIHHDNSILPHQHIIKFNDEEKKILFKNKNRKRLIPTSDMLNHDELNLPGYDQNNIIDLVNEYNQRKVELTATNCSMLIHMFTRFSVMIAPVFEKLEKQAFRLKGQFKIRPIYGGLHGSIVHNRPKLIQFFLKQYEFSQQKFIMEETYDIMNAYLDNGDISHEEKINVWTKYFRADFLNGLYNVQIKKPKLLINIFDMMNKLGEEQPQIWKRIIALMKKPKNKWSGIPLMEKLYSISDKYPEAEAKFNQLFQKLSQDHEMVRQYNFTELRYFTPLQLIQNAKEKYSDFSPKIKTIIPEGENADQWNENYLKHLSGGAVKQEAEIVKDKSKSLGFAIRDRYQNLQADGLDFSKMSKEEFQEMFGDFSQAMKTIEFEDARIANSIQQLGENSIIPQEQDPDQSKSKKGKKDKKENKSENKVADEEPPKQKKQKSKKKEV